MPPSLLHSDIVLDHTSIGGTSSDFILGPFVFVALNPSLLFVFLVVSFLICHYGFMYHSIFFYTAYSLPSSSVTLS